MKTLWITDVQHLHLNDTYSLDRFSLAHKGKQFINRTACSLIHCIYISFIAFCATGIIL